MNQKASRFLSLNEIQEPASPLRLTISPTGLSALAASMDTHGLLQPIVVATGKEGYTIIAGHRRYLAAKMLKWEHIECKVLRRVPPDRETLSLIENVHREDLTPVEEARLIAHLAVDVGMDVDLIGRRFGKGRAWVDARLELNHWPQDIRDALHAKDIPIIVARHLQRITDEGYRRYLIQTAIDNGASGRTAQMWVEDWERTLRETGQVPTAVPSSTPPYSGQAVGVACAACATLFPVSQLTTIYVCRPCLEPRPEQDFSPHDNHKEEAP